MSSKGRSSIFQILKQRFTGPKTIELAVSAYGKLPIYKDFLRHGLAGAEAQALKRWLDQGVSKFWATREGYREDEIQPQALLLSFPATGQQVLGYLWGSHDHGALRRFPFVLFVSLPSNHASAPLVMLDALGQVVSQAMALRMRLQELNDLDAFYPLIRTSSFMLTIQSERTLCERLETAKEPSVAALGEALYGDRAEELWPALLGHLVRCSQQKDQEFTARLPGCDLLPEIELASLWCLLLADARRNTRKPLQLVYSPRDPDAGMTILHRNLRPEDVFAFHPAMPEYEAIDDLRQQVPRGALFETSKERLQAPYGTVLKEVS